MAQGSRIDRRRGDCTDLRREEQLDLFNHLGCVVVGQRAAIFKPAILGGHSQPAIHALHKLALIILRERQHFGQTRRRAARGRVWIEGCKNGWLGDAGGPSSHSTRRCSSSIASVLPSARGQSSASGMVVIASAPPSDWSRPTQNFFAGPTLFLRVIQARLISQTIFPVEVTSSHPDIFSYRRSLTGSHPILKL